MIPMSSVYASDQVYILLDKSNSMWAHESHSGLPIIEVAKNRIFQLLDDLPPQAGRRRITFVLFDSRLKDSFSQDIVDINSAKLFLDKFEPGGKTTIGDRIEEIRKQIIDSGIGSVEVHLFSDLNETLPGKIPLEEAVRRMNKSLEQDLKNLDWRLYCYTWKNITKDGAEYEGISEDKIKRELPLPNVISVPVHQESIFSFLESPDSFIVNIKDEDGVITEIGNGTTRLRGKIHPDLIRHGINLRIIAFCKELPGLKIQINDRDVYDASSHADRYTGKFDIKGVKIAFKNPDILHQYLNSSFMNQTHLLYFEPYLSPDSAEVLSSPNIVKPRIVKTSFNFASQASLYIKNYNSGKKLYRTRILEGGTVIEPFELAWNTGAIGKVLTWELPAVETSIGFLRTPGNVPIDQPFRLDDTLNRTVVFQMDNIKTVKKQKVIFSILNTPAKAEVSVDITALPPTLSINVKTDNIRIPLTNAPVEITDAFLLDPNWSKRSLPVTLKIDDSQNKNASDFDFIIYDPLDPDFLVKLGGPIVERDISFPRFLNYRIKANRYDDREVNFFIRFSQGQIKYNGKSQTQFTHKITIRMVQPKLDWWIVNSQSGKQLGSSEGKPIKFFSRGESVTTADEALRRNGFLVESRLNVEVNGIASVRLRAVVYSDEPTEKRLIKGVIFNETGEDECRIDQFLNNPHVTLIVDAEKKPLLGTNRDSGHIAIELASGNKQTGLISPILHYKLGLRP